MAPRIKKAPLTDTSTLKRFTLMCRESLEMDAWSDELVEITAFLVTPSGALTMFHRRTPQRCLAAGYLRDLTLISESEREDAE